VKRIGERRSPLPCDSIKSGRAQFPAFLHILASTM
jgi:hypothetical protein